MNLTVIRLLILALLLPLCTSCGYAKSDNRTAQIFSQSAVIREGMVLAERERFEEALLKFDEALDPKYIGKESDKSYPHHNKARVYRVLGKYSLALKESELSNQYANKKSPSNYHLELEVLARYESTGDKQLVLDYIDQYIKSRKFPVMQSMWAVATLIRLYDAIGEYDKGIEFVDKFVEDLYSSDEFKTARRPSSIEEATKWIEHRNPDGSSDPDWRGYALVRDLMRIREGFELDKKQGTKGRATRAILPSKYLSW